MLKIMKELPVILAHFGRHGGAGLGYVLLIAAIGVVAIICILDNKNDRKSDK